MSWHQINLYLRIETSVVMLTYLPDTADTSTLVLIFLVYIFYLQNLESSSAEMMSGSKH